MAAVDIRQERDDILRNVGCIVRISPFTLGEPCAEYGEVNVQSEILCPGLFDEVYKVCDQLALQVGRCMDLRAHLDAQLFCQRKRSLDDLSPVKDRLEQVVDDRHLCSHDCETETVRQTDISLEHLNRLLCRKVSVPEHMGIDPVAVFHRNDLIFVAESPPLLDPFIRGVRIVLDVCVGKDLDPVRTHIVHIFKTILQGLGQYELG